MKDSEIIKQLIEDRIKLESQVSSMVEVLKMADNVIENCVIKKQEANFTSTDVRHEIARNLAWVEAR